MTIKHTPGSDLRAIQSLYGEKQVVVSDLSKVLMAPFQLAMDIASHFGKEALTAVMQEVTRPIVKKHTGSDYEYWIDYDSIGNVARIKAVKLFSLLHKQIENNELAIVVKLNSASFSEDNLALLELIHHELPNTVLHVCGEPDVVSMLAFAYVESVSVDGASAQEQASSPLQAVTILPDQLLLNGAVPTESNIVFFGQEVNADKHAREIMQYAWMITNFDAIELALNIFRAGYELAQHPATKLHYLLCLQVTRVGLQRYDDVMAQVYPETVEDPKLQEALFYSKAYAGVLSRRFEEAGKYFDALNISENLSTDSVESLYRLNIYALYLFHSKKKETALQVEQLILKNLEKFSNQNTIFIEYINALNLSRVYRANKDFPVAKKYCDMAYASICGLHTESDLVYHNLNNGMLHESLGDYKEAFYDWLRAAMHWQAMSCQTALAWRPLAALMGRDFRFNQSVDVARINKTFLDKITELSALAGMEFPKTKHVHVEFKHAEQSADFVTDKYIGCEGVSFLAGSVANVRKENKNNLNSLLASILQVLTGTEFNDNALLLLDVDRGFGMIRSEDDLRARCVALGLSTYTFNGVDKMVDEGDIQNMHASVSPVVYKVVQTNDQTVVQFKRYHADVVLTEEDRALLDKVAVNQSLPLSDVQDISAVRRLYQSNILCLKAC